MQIMKKNFKSSSGILVTAPFCAITMALNLDKKTYPVKLVKLIRL